MNKVPATESILDSSPAQGLFSLTFSNSRRHGLRPVKTQHCQGVRYASGHVHLDTQGIVVTDFASLSQMCEHLEHLGYFRVEWEEQA